MSSSLVHALDKQQSLRSETARFCQVDKDHGRMKCNASGTLLLCTAKDCGYREPARDPRE